MPWLRRLVVGLHCGGLGSRPFQSMFDLLWRKWYWDRFKFEFLSFPLSISLYWNSILIYYLEDEHARWWPQIVSTHPHAQLQQSSLSRSCLRRNLFLWGFSISTVFIFHFLCACYMSDLSHASWNNHHNNNKCGVHVTKQQLTQRR
jgi:hypothetical protein